MKKIKYILIIITCIIICILLGTSTVDMLFAKYDERGFKIANMKIYKINKAIENEDLGEVKRLIKHTNLNKLPLVVVKFEDRFDPKWEDDTYQDYIIYYDNFTPLTKACLYGDEKIIRLLLDNGADVNYREPLNKDTPLIYLLRSYWSIDSKDIETIKILLEYGADSKNIKNKIGYTALDYAKKSKNKILINLLS